MSEQKSNTQARSNKILSQFKLSQIPLKSTASSSSMSDASPSPSAPPPNRTSSNCNPDNQSTNMMGSSEVELLQPKQNISTIPVHSVPLQSQQVPMAHSSGK